MSETDSVQRWKLTDAVAAEILDTDNEYNKSSGLFKDVAKSS